MVFYPLNLTKQATFYTFQIWIHSTPDGSGWWCQKKCNYSNFLILKLSLDNVLDGPFDLFMNFVHLNYLHSQIYKPLLGVMVRTRALERVPVYSNYVLHIWDNSLKTQSFSILYNISSFSWNYHIEWQIFRGNLISIHSIQVPWDLHIGIRPRHFPLPRICQEL